MNSKCRKSNLVVHWNILLFAYLPAPVVSYRNQDLAPQICNDRHIFSPCLSLISSRLLLSPFHSCPSFSPSTSICFPRSTSLIPSLPVSLRHQGLFPPRQDAWQGSRWNGEQMTNLPLPFSPHLTHCPARGPPQRSCLPPSSTFPSYLTALIFKSKPGCIPPCLLLWRSRQTTKEGIRKRWDSVPTLVSEVTAHMLKGGLMSTLVYLNIWAVKLLSYKVMVHSWRITLSLKLVLNLHKTQREKAQESGKRKYSLRVCSRCHWHGPTWHASTAKVSHLAMSYHYLCLLLSDESAPAPCWGAGLYLMGSFSRGLLGGSLLQTHLKKGLWISWLPGHSLLLSIRWSPRLYPSVNGPGEQWMQQFLIPEMPLSTVCLAVPW